MAHAIIFHGTGARPEYIWYPWLAARLRDRGYTVETPHYPGTNVDPVAVTLREVLANHELGEDTVVVGHSGGAALLLALLERVRVRQAVLVAGYSTQPNDSAEPVLQDAYDWAAIRGNVADLWFLNSVTDEFGCDAGQGRAMFDRLGGTLVVRDDGHFLGDTLDLVDRVIP